MSRLVSHLLALAAGATVIGSAVAQQSPPAPTAPAKSRAPNVTMDMNAVTRSGVGKKLGTVSISDTPKGARFAVNVSGLSPGVHGFHVHENGSCAPGAKDGRMQAGIAAGEHFDPAKTGKHRGPKGSGHKGDLPTLKIAKATTISTVVVPHLKLEEVRGRSLVIHERGDTYSDKPESGGGGRRVACGVIPKQ